MDTHEVLDTHFRDPQGSRVEIPVDQTMANKALDPGLGDHGLVDMVNFCLLQTRTACLESHITSINQNLMDLTNLVKNIVINPIFMAPRTSGALQPSPVEPQDQVTKSSGGDWAQHPSLGAENTMHGVQILAFTECPKYLAVEVNHNSCEHNCELTTLPWQVGPHELFCLHGTING